MGGNTLWLKRDSQAALVGDVLLYWSQCHRRGLLQWGPFGCVLPHISTPRHKSQLSGMRSQSFSYVSSNATCSPQTDVSFQGWNCTGGKAPVFPRSVKKPQKLTCSNGHVLGSTGSLLVEHFGNQKVLRSVASISTDTEQGWPSPVSGMSKGISKASGISKTFIDYRLIFFLSYTTLPLVYQVLS